MVDFKDAEIKQILPVNLCNSKAQALSFAVGNAMKRMRSYAMSASVYARLSLVPDEVLNLLALELNTQYYEQTLPRKVREELVRQTVSWYIRAGTPSVLQEFLKTVLDGGYIEEWFDYKGSPYCFKAYARAGAEHEIPLGYGKEIQKRLEIYKNVRSHMEFFMFIISGEYEVKVGYKSAITFGCRLYPLGNAPLKLDGTWKLDGQGILGKYWEDRNMFPANLQMAMAAALEIGQESQMNIWGIIGAVPKLGAVFSYTGKQKVETGAEMQLGFKTKAEICTGTGAIYVTVLNQLDGTWKLNGKRKLNGGVYVR